LGELSEIYWRPIFAFILRQGYSRADAQDLTQDFFIEVFRGRLVQLADPSRGRFRCLLLTALKNFLCDRKLKALRRKRGGGIRFESIEGFVEALDFGTVAAEGLTTYPAEAVFDLNWAATIATQALRRLREDCESKGHRSTFECLRDYLTIDRSETCYRHLSLDLRLPETSVKRLIHQFRTRYRALLREEVAKTVESTSDIETEVRYLCTVLAAAPVTIS
jgi:RNA polymerase sigma-70 factor (ECF subfamily)